MCLLHITETADGNAHGQRSAAVHDVIERGGELKGEVVISRATHGGEALLFTARSNENTARHGLWTSGTVASLIGNDTLPAKATLTFAQVTGPAHGTLVLRPDGGFIYQPNAGYSGPDQFTYSVSDGADTSAPATATITVTTM